MNRAKRAMSAPSAAKKRRASGGGDSLSAARLVLTRPSDMVTEDETLPDERCQARVSPWRRWAPRLLRVGAAAGVVGALVFFVRRLDFAELRRALASAAPVPIAVASLLAFANLWFKAWYWRVMLARYPHVSTLRIFRYTLAGVVA